jgi:UDP-N-acetylmuramoyl-tripeptide--D-alanyl-D-alanine ligase
MTEGFIEKNRYLTGGGALQTLTLSEILKAAGASNPGLPGETVISCVCTDSRTVKGGDLFIPLAGENFDGHRFIAESLEKGAAAALSSKGVPEGVPEEKVIYVSDTLKAYQDIAGYYRRRFPVKVAAVTGSNGKTTTKEILWALLSADFRTLKSEENHNNEVGVPLTLLRLDGEHERAVVEIAMRGREQIRPLARLAYAQVGLITNVGEAHYELLGSHEAIADAKGELLEEMGSDSTAVLNVDNQWFSHLARKVRGRLVRFGMTKPSDVNITVVEKLGPEGFWLRGRAFGRTWEAQLPMAGHHNLYNFLGALAAALVLGMKLESIERGLANLPPRDKRMEFIEAPGGFTIINDAYNAAPASMKAALLTLADIFTEGRRIAVLGDMLELGTLTDPSHECVGKLAASLAIDRLCTVGEKAKLIAESAVAEGMPKGHVTICESNAEAYEHLASSLEPGDIVLFKASRRMRLEEIVARLMERPAVGSVA